MSRVLLAVAAVTLAGCSIPQQLQPEAIEAPPSGQRPTVTPTASSTWCKARDSSQLPTEATTRPSDAHQRTPHRADAAKARGGRRTAIPAGSVTGDVTLADGLAPITKS